MEELRFTIIEPGHPTARRMLRAYLSEVAERYYGHPVSGTALEAVEALEPSDDLVDPTGVLIVAYRDESPVGCGGLRIVDETTAELTRVFSAREARGTGVGRAIVRELERLAVERGMGTIRLDTRTDLVEARALYASLGYAEVEAFNAGEYAQHWFAKQV